MSNVESAFPSYSVGSSMLQAPPPPSEADFAEVKYEQKNRITDIYTVTPVISGNIYGAPLPPPAPD